MTMNVAQAEHYHRHIHDAIVILDTPSGYQSFVKQAVSRRAVKCVDDACKHVQGAPTAGSLWRLYEKMELPEFFDDLLEAGVTEIDGIFHLWCGFLATYKELYTVIDHVYYASDVNPEIRVIGAQRGLKVNIPTLIDDGSAKEYMQFMNAQ